MSIYLVQAAQKLKEQQQQQQTPPPTQQTTQPVTWQRTPEGPKTVTTTPPPTTPTQPTQLQSETWQRTPEGPKTVAPPTPIYPLPPEHGTSNYIVQGNYIQTGTKITDKEGNLLGIVGTPTQPKIQPNQTYYIQPPEPQPQTPKPPPTLPELLSNPVVSVKNLFTETIGPTMNLAGKATAKSDNTALQAGVAVLGTVSNQVQKTYGAALAVGNFFTGKESTPRPAPYTPSSDVQRDAAQAFEVGQLAAVAVAAPIAAPSWGVVAAEALGAGFNVGAKAVTGQLSEGKFGLAKDVAEGAAFGGGFAVVGGGAVGAVGLVGKGIVPSVGRVAVNAGLGAAAGGLHEGYATGQISGAGLAYGAAFGAGFGVVGETVPAFTRAVAPKVMSAASKDPFMQKVVFPTEQKIVQSEFVQSTKEAAKAFKDRVVGSQFAELKGVDEVFVQQTAGKQTTINKVTRPNIEVVRLRGKELEMYRQNNLQNMKNPIVELEGVQKVTVKQKDVAGVMEEITTYPKEASKVQGKTLDVVGDVNKEFGVIEKVTPYNKNEMLLRDPTVVYSSRSAKPIVAAVKGEPLSVTKATAVTETNLSVAKGEININKTRFIKETELLPDTVIAERHLKLVNIYDKSNTSELYAKATGKPKPVKETPELYEKVTGKIAKEPELENTFTQPLVTKEQLKILKTQKDTQKLFEKTVVNKEEFLKKEAGDYSGAMKAGSNKFFRSKLEIPEETIGTSKTKTETATTQKAPLKEAKVERAILGEAKTTSYQNMALYGGSVNAVVLNPFTNPKTRPYYYQKQQANEEYEYNYSAPPKSGLPHPNINISSLKQKTPTNITPLIKTDIFTGQKPKEITKPSSNFQYIQRQTTYETPDLNEKVQQATKQTQDLFTLPKTPTDQQLREEPRQIKYQDIMYGTPKTMYTTTSPFGGKIEGKGSSDPFIGKKGGLKSKRFVNPLLEGEQLLGL